MWFDTIDAIKYHTSESMSCACFSIAWSESILQFLPSLYFLELSRALSGNWLLEGWEPTQEQMGWEDVTVNWKVETASEMINSGKGNQTCYLKAEKDSLKTVHRPSDNSIQHWWLLWSGGWIQIVSERLGPNFHTCANQSAIPKTNRDRCIVSCHHQLAVCHHWSSPFSSSFGRWVKYVQSQLRITYSVS